MIDTHCHLADTQLDSDRGAVLDRARAAGVSPIITIADSMPEAEKCLRLCAEHADLFCAVGVHPHHAKDWRATDAETLREMTRRSDKVVAIGEIGLDFHYDFSPRDVQVEVFCAQLMLARELNLPAVVHCREAIEAVRSILLELRPQRAVIHCCTEKWADVERLVAAGYHLSFTGIATYPRSEEIRETIRRCPIDRIMVETDAPYLAPVPHRGQRNEPAYVAEVLRLIADLKGLSPEETDAITTRTAVEFFRLPQG